MPFACGQGWMDTMRSDRTEVVGHDGGVQGLSTKSGSKLKITYTEEKDQRTALKIEIADGW